MPRAGSYGTEALIGLPVNVDAHLYGAVAGMLLALYPRIPRKTLCIH